MFSRGLPMVTLGRILFGGLALHLLFLAHNSGVYAHPPTQSIADLASRLLPSVVNISTTQVQLVTQIEYTPQSWCVIAIESYHAIHNR